MTLAAAQDLARRGFYVFPLRKGGKKPAHTGWQDEATNDPDRVAVLWGNRPFNVGISTSRFGDGQALLVVDVDSPGHGNGTKNGPRRLLELELEGKAFPLTLEHSTPTGGRHLVYVVDEAVKQGVDVLGAGLDIRSAGGYVVAPGSTVDAGSYFTDRPAAPVAAPGWLVDACGRPRPKALNREPLAGVDPERARARGIEYLKSAPQAIEGAGGDDTTFRVAARLLELGNDPDATFDLMASEHWFDGCGWAPDELRQKIANADKYMHEPRGAAAPEAQFEPAVPETDAPELQDKLHPFAELNREYAFVIAGGGHHILWETTDEFGHPVVEHIKEDTFHKKFSAVKFRVGEKSVPLTKAWMNSPRRRSYDKLVFAPEQKIESRFYNTWRGFTTTAVEPAKASPRARAAVDAWGEHVLQNLCSGNAEHARWLIGYFAHMIQRPWEKPLTALVFKGKKGTGKNAAVDRVGELFSGNYFVADDNRYLTGNFNSHLESCLTLVLDEAQWAGDKKAEGRLKGLITGTHHLIERKGSEPYKVRNLTRVIIIGNERWLVPATEDERRYAVFNVGEGRKQDRTFFREMREGMEANGGEGYGLLLHTLRQIDLTGIDLNNAPRTQGLLDQKRESLEPTQQWWLESLEAEELLGSDFGGEWPATVACNRVIDASRRYAKERGIGGRAPGTKTFNAIMAEMIPGWTRKKTTAKAVQPGDTTYHYALPPLDEARAMMRKYMGDDS